MTGTLDEYRRKRDFSKTKEPTGGNVRSGQDPAFVIQKHASAHLHYDVRLEIDGVLVSWAVPKGPSADPAVRRLAIRTEDHPPDYLGFEGVIPEGEYGAGTVMVWDTGVYRNIRAGKGEESMDMAGSVRDGKVEVWLEGSKVSGGYAFIRTRGGEKPAWLFFKMADEKADPGIDLTGSMPDSALTGRSMEEIEREAGDGDRKKT